MIGGHPLFETKHARVRAHVGFSVCAITRGNWWIIVSPPPVGHELEWNELERKKF